jgi:uncharacterized protein YcfJ
MTNQQLPRNALLTAALSLAFAASITPALAKGPPAHAAVPAHAAAYDHGDRRTHRGQSGRYYDDARVVDVRPVYREVRVSQPRRECHDQRVVSRHRQGPGEAGSAIIGAILGGVAGNQIGSGSGRDAATVVGAIAGTAAGSHYARRQGRTVERSSYETVCHTVNDVHYEERVDGYRVTYRYRGREHTTRMDRRPGDRIRVRVGVDPVHR